MKKLFIDYVRELVAANEQNLSSVYYGALSDDTLTDAEHNAIIAIHKALENEDFDRSYERYQEDIEANKANKPQVIDILRPKKKS